MDEIETERMLFKLATMLPPQLVQFFNMKSREMIPEKRAVLEALSKGMPIDEIPGFYDILEFYPMNEDDTDIVLWD